MITKVKLKNWKSHLNTDLRFGDGTNVLVGSMGAGKSAVLDAITYALFGTLPAVQTRRIRLEDLIMNRPDPMDRTEVEVGFLTPDGDEFTVKRVIERGRGTALSELRKGTGELVEGPSSTRVSEVIRSLLKLDYDLFERAIYSEQNRLDYFLALPRGKRMESIDELLGINKLELARKEVGSLVNRVKDRVEERKGTVQQLGQDASLALLPTYEQEMRDLEFSKHEIQTRLQQIQPELEAALSQLQQLRKTEQELARLDSSSRELEGAINALSRQLEQIRGRLGAAVGIAPEGLKRRAADLERACREADARVSELNSNLTTSSSRVRELETKIGMLHERLERLVSEIERKRKLSEELDGLGVQGLTELIEKLQLESRNTGDELAASHARVQDLQQVMNELVAAGSTCPVCERPLEEGKKQQLVEERRSQLEAKLKRVAELEARVRELNENLDEKLELQRKAQLLAKEVEELPAREAERSQLFQQLQNLERELPNMREVTGKLAVKVEGARREAEALHEQFTATKQLLQLRLDLDQLELEHKQKLADQLRVQRELWQVKRAYDEARAKELERRYEELIRTHEHLRTELVGKEQMISEKRKLIASVREKREMIARYETEIKHLEDAARALTTIQAALARTQTAMRREFIDGVNEAMSELWESVYPYGDFTGIKLAVEGGERGGDYVLQLRDRGGNWIPVEGIASGGERTDACLALRIAFAVVLAPSLSWIVLDEPTHNLDEGGIQELARVLRERLPEIVQQILIITHEQRLEEAVSGYLYRFSRNKDADEPTRAERVTVPEKFD
jgi:exonuclease SbcC